MMDQHQDLVLKYAKAASRRQARLYAWQHIDRMGLPVHDSTRELEAAASAVQNHPVVVISLAAGIIGVLMVILIVFTVWLRRRCDAGKPAAELDMTTFSTTSCQTQVSMPPTSVYVIESETSANSLVNPNAFTNSSAAPTQNMLDVV